MAWYRVLSWRGIPSQVKIRDDHGRPLSRSLPGSFQQDIDRTAMREGATGSDAYLEGWVWSDDRDWAGAAEDVADDIVRHVIADWRQGLARAPDIVEPEG